jgi:hypothetical protein
VPVLPLDLCTDVEIVLGVGPWHFLGLAFLSVLTLTPLSVLTLSFILMLFQLPLLLLPPLLLPLLLLKPIPLSYWQYSILLLPSVQPPPSPLVVLHFLPFVRVGAYPRTRNDDHPGQQGWRFF